MKLTEHFSSEEMACKCNCGDCDVDTVALEMLESARVVAGIPFKITSAKRCKEHNAKVGGVSSSAHVDGYAFDISVYNNSANRFRVVKALIFAGFTRIGIAKTFIHCDASPKLPKHVLWMY